MRVLVGDLALSVQDEDRDVGPVDRLQGLHHGKFLDAFEHLAAAPQSRRVDQNVTTAPDR